MHKYSGPQIESKKERAIALIELTGFTALIVTAVIFLWNLWVRKELDLTMRMAAMHVLNDQKLSTFRPFYLDPNQGLVQYPSCDPNAIAGLTRLGELILAQIRSSSPLGTSVGGLWCALRLNYLLMQTNPNVVNPPQGSVTALGNSVPPPPASGCTTTGSVKVGSVPGNTTPLQNLINSNTTSYFNRLQGQPLGGPISLTNFVTQQGVPASSYFGYSAFYSWACEGTGMMLGLLPFKSQVSDVVVPVR